MFYSHRHLTHTKVTWTLPVCKVLPHSRALTFDFSMPNDHMYSQSLLSSTESFTMDHSSALQIQPDRLRTRQQAEMLGILQPPVHSTDLQGSSSSEMTCLTICLQKCHSGNLTVFVTGATTTRLFIRCWVSEISFSCLSFRIVTHSLLSDYEIQPISKNSMDILLAAS